MRVTRATLKSFIRKNEGKLLVSCRSSFDGMVDGCVDASDKSFQPARPTDIKCAPENTLGIAGVWLVLGGRDRIDRFEADGMTIMDVYNCCGHFQLAAKN